MRDIKFRAFISKDATGEDAGFMHYPDDDSDFEMHTNGSSGFSMICDFERWVDKDKFIVMQFTGLTDKNGFNDVYEGDIIGLNGLIKGNIYETQQTELDLVIPSITGEEWVSAYKKGLERGLINT